MERIVSLRGREHEPRVAKLLAMAQVHRPLEERAARGLLIAAAYASSKVAELWGYQRDGALVGLAGVEVRGAVLWLSDLAVTPEARSTGVGRRLVAFLREEYPGLPIEGDTVAESAGFYLACGFEVREAGLLSSGERVLRFRLGS
jgi:N-acetylglutamate synthase-like GNAT family acetyltransferase